MKRSWRVAFIASLAFNLLVVAGMTAWVARKGGPRYVLEQMGLVRSTFKPQPWQREQIATYRALPNTAGEIVFVGDSITRGIPWSEYYSDLRNRGLGGDTADGILQRLDEIIESHPRQVFLNVGTNDLAKETPLAQVIQDIETIVRRVRTQSPETELVLCSVLPINFLTARDVRLEAKARNIPVLNAQLRRIAAEAKAKFVDLGPAFTDENGHLKAELTSGDGLHLNERGGAVYCKNLEPHVKSAFLEAQRSSSRRPSPSPAPAAR